MDHLLPGLIQQFYELPNIRVIAVSLGTSLASVRSAVYFAFEVQPHPNVIKKTKKRIILRFLLILWIIDVNYIRKRNIMRNVKLELGEVIKKRRELLGLLQPQLASISGVSTRTIQLVETGKGNPALDTLLQLAAPLGLTLQLTLKDLSKQDKH